MRHDPAMRLYLAGPEVFLSDAAELAAAKKQICAAHGLEGVFPTDPIPTALAEEEDWFRLYRLCEAHLRRCDELVANMTPFRGPSADVGTVFEMGMMRCLGRPVFAYSNVGSELRQRVHNQLSELAPGEFTPRLIGCGGLTEHAAPDLKRTINSGLTSDPSTGPAESRESR